MKILVTGGCGFIGSCVVEQLIRQGHDVTNLDSMTYAAANGRRLLQWAGSSRYTLHKVDITHYGEVAAIMGAVAWDVVIHMAAETHVDRSIDDGSVFVQTNIHGTYVMLDAVRAYCPEARFVYVSTDEVYGPIPGRELADEGRRLRPKNPYAATKAASEHLVESYCNTYGLKAVITRGTNTAGPMQAPEKLIPMVCFRALRDMPIPVFGGGGQRRQWLGLKDHADAICTLATIDVAKLGFRSRHSPWMFNIGDANGILANLDVVNMILGLFNKPTSLIEHVEDRPGHDDRYAVSTRKASQMLRWGPKQGCVDALHEAVVWNRDHGQEFWKDELENLLERRGTA